ncbi:facilitated trehalose transporter Tret1-like [Planococcus citri]|uniref:facilitated trehalose transporter Tret1-like n=1 Tax=Planococcus citri TaxID=170843 RepID=UPI0031F7BAB7
MKTRETFHQTLAVMTVGLNELGLAVGNGWLAPVLKTLQDAKGDFSLTTEQCSWIASLEHIGKIFGATIAAILLDIVGRKSLLSICAMTFFLMWLAILFTKSVFIIYVVRIVFGVACGINDGTNSVYLGENSSPFIRGIFGTVSISIYFLGLLIELIIATYLSYKTTALVNFFIEFASFMSVFWMVEPVQYLLMKGKYDQAEKNFIWLKGARDPNEVSHEFEKIKQNAYAEISKKSSYVKILTSPANYKSLLMMLTIYSLAGMTGYHPVQSFASMIFSSTDILTPNEFTILLGVVQFLVVASTSFVIGKFNRRSIILISFSVISIAHAFTALLFVVHNTMVRIPSYPWLIFLSITVYFSIFAFAYPALFLIRSELFPLSIKGIGGSVAIVGYSAMSFLMTKIFLFVSQNYGIHFNFMIFSLISAILVLFVYRMLPETRNKSLIEIQELLEKEN